MSAYDTTRQEIIGAKKIEPETEDVGCPHDHPDCEGADANRERPVLCFDCWNDWASN